ncbi:MAG: hypothetical protein KDN05_01910, partial [Verrucomicrobiae bacterium]|nr:hypothetical protein [Verrucomicrobiae bacterium]
LLGRYPLIQQATFKYYLDEQVVPRKTKLIACLNILQTHSGPEIGFSCATQLEYLRASEQERFFCEILRGFLARSTNWRRNIEILENLKVASLEELVVESGGLTASSLSAVVFLISDLTNELGKGGKAAYMRALNAIAMVPGNPRAVYLLLSAEVTKKPEVVKELADLEKDADIDESLRAAIKLKLVKSLDDK